MAAAVGCFQQLRRSTFRQSREKGEMSKRKDNDRPSSGNPSNIKLEAVNPLWLTVSPEEKWVAAAG